MEVFHNISFTANLHFRQTNGSEVRIIILKTTYELNKNGKLTIAEEQEPICEGDQFLNKPTFSSTLYEDDTAAYFKPATDIFEFGEMSLKKNMSSCFNAILYK